MNSRLIAMTLAGLMAVQTTAMASTSRIEGISDQAIADAKAQLNALQSQVDTLDATLAQAEKSIAEREKSGRLLNATNITGAAIGAGLTALSYMTLRKVGVAGVGQTVSIGAGVFTVVSALSSYVEGVVKGETVTIETAKQIEAVRANVRASFSDLNDDDTNEQLAELDTRLKYLLGDLGRFNQSENEAAKAAFKAQLTQVLGVALTITGGSIGQGQLMTLGTVIYSAGNISTLLRSLEDSQAELILKEIADTRKQVQETFVAQ